MSRIKLALIMPWRENKGVANLNGFRRILLVAYGKKSLEEIFVEMLLTQEIINFTIIFKENPY
ncbi:hypothetical protein [Prevotella sp. P5-50]|uniref:hypothetical protein n=1 Tax=Prevotella sp. P5-50 TaxID=2024217 RepID=UPI000B971BB5|nr:hypothetical protein [Prevotella sp. P5-50]OYP41851.1 hypothetical protein CIK88_03735 [Prevotella sp. P5-50]